MWLAKSAYKKKSLNLKDHGSGQRGGVEWWTHAEGSENM
jgi:hypothetical protein